VKIVETVLRGCNGNKSPIAGLLDAAADRDISSVLIKIDKASNAKRIAFEAARNLSLVGYTAEAKSMSIVGEGSKGRADLNALSTAFEVVANTEPQDVFDWTVPCTCPDNGILRGDCLRHSQMNTRIFEAFAAREEQVNEYMAGCAMKYGMDCTCGPGCRCKNCPIHSVSALESEMVEPMDTTYCPMPPPLSPSTTEFDEPPIQIDQPMDLSSLLAPTNNLPTSNALSFQGLDAQLHQTFHQPQHTYRTRNLSILSIGNSGFRGSIGRASNSGRPAGRNSEATFGRAMSGLSALSIDWENLEDFDVDEDHSSHIQQHQQHQQQRNSIRRAVMNGDAAKT
jgi:hypothetical protein